MKSLPAIFTTTLLVAGLIATAALTFLCGVYSWQAVDLELRASSEFGLTERGLDLGRSVLYYSSIGFLGEDPRKRKENTEALQRQAAEAGRKANQTMLAAMLAASVVIFLPKPYPVPWASRQTRLVAFSGLFLFPGVLLPVLSSVTALTLPVIGQIVLVSGSKSILGTIRDLMPAAPVLGIALLIFSVVTPGIKIVSLVYLLKSPRARHLSHWTERIGRWSMADVFVVSLVLTFLALGQNPASFARIEPGLYFFGASALLALIAGHRFSSTHADTKARPPRPDAKERDASPRHSLSPEQPEA